MTTAQGEWMTVAEAKNNGHNWHGKSATVRLNLDELDALQGIIAGLPVNAEMLVRLSTKLRNCKFSILRRHK